MSLGSRKYDPAAKENASRFLPGVELCEDAYQVAAGSDAMTMVTKSSKTGTPVAIVLLAALSLCLCLALLALCALLGARFLSDQETGGDGPPVSLFVTPTPADHGSSGAPTATRAPGVQGAPPAATATPRPLPTPEPADYETEVRLAAVEIPERDLRSLAERLTGQGPIPEIAASSPASYQVGDEAEFWVGNVDTMEQVRVTAVLEYVTDHLYMWVQQDLPFDRDALARSAETFETHIYPTTRTIFGSEWSPGVDSDPRLYILNASSQQMGRSVAGYYSSSDEYSRLANPYSNEHEMFYVAMDGGMRPGSEFYNGVLTHEFQHMIHWAADRNEDTWVNEGLSELAAYLGGYDPGGFDYDFLADPDLQLNTWPELADASPHYGGSYLFMLYLYGRFGSDLIGELVARPENGIPGLDAVLSSYGVGFNEVYGDWLIANYIEGTRVDVDQVDPRYTYLDRMLGRLSVDYQHDQFPAQRESTVKQYGTDYVELAAAEDLSIEFAGEKTARLVPADAYSGRYAWWSNRGDVSNTTLTRAFDLRPLETGTLSSATLSVHMWYDIEPDWDYAYVEVSADGGATWEILSGPSSTDYDPNGNSFGAAYTGSSEGWIEETFDLSEYIGQEVLVRFEYVTDDAVNRAGWLIDDVCILETGLCDDFESGVGDWEARGFVYSDNLVGQRYLVQVILITEGGELRVLRVPLDAAQQGRLELRGLSRRDRAALVISAMAPATTEETSYQYSIEPLQ
jgi:hypothetical protein